MAAETLRAALADLERREGELEERLRTVDAQCQEKVAAMEALAADKLKEVEEAHTRCMHVHEQARARLETLRGQVEHGQSGRIKLNVGGSVFETTIATLTKFPDTFFYAAFVSFNSGKPAPLDADGCYFIDRNGTHFGGILDFLRKGKVRLPVDAGDIDDLMDEVRYYMLEEPFHAALTAQRAIEHELHMSAPADQGNAIARWPDFTRKEVLQMVAAGQTRFAGCKLDGLDLSGVHFVRRTNFTNASLRRTDLRWADLPSAYFVRADLSHADLSHARLNSANLSHADLSHAGLNSADLSLAGLNNADLTGAEVTGWNITDAYVPGMARNDAIWDSNGNRHPWTLDRV